MYYQVVILRNTIYLRRMINGSSLVKCKKLFLSTPRHVCVCVYVYVIFIVDMEGVELLRLNMLEQSNQNYYMISSSFTWMCFGSDS